MRQGEANPREPEGQASNLLDERIALCEHAYALATSSTQVMPLQTLRAHLAKSTALWAKFPYTLQIKVWQRHAVEDFLLACGTGEGKDKDGSSSSTAKKKSNTKVGSKESMSSLEAFFGALKWEQKAGKLQWGGSAVLRHPGLHDA